MANEEEAVRQGLNPAKANATRNEEQQQIVQPASTLDESELEVTIHQSIDEYNHI